MSSFHLRLDIGIGIKKGSYHDALTNPFDGAFSHSAGIIDGGEGAPHPEFEIAFNHRTTFADVLRNAFEVHLLGGHLLDFLQYNSQNSNGQERKELHMLAYSKEDATLVQPYWSSRGTTVQKSKQQLLLQLSSGSGGRADIVIDPSTLVISFIEDHPWDPFEKMRKLNSGRGVKFIDMKLITKLASQVHEPINLNILLCEEDWREHCKGKLLPWKTVLFTHKSPTATISTRSDEQHHPGLKSFLIPDFLGSNHLLIAMAFLAPTSLVLRGVDTFDGVQPSVDKPSFCQTRALNFERPAVLRQYFGVNLEDAMSLPPPRREGEVWRKVYGLGSGSQTVGIHPE